MAKHEIIEKLTALMSNIQAAYYKGAMEGHRLWVHETGGDDAAICIDLYNFGGDGKPVCEGLNPCTITYDDETKDTVEVFCMHYDPDGVTPLTFVADHYDEDEGDIDTFDIGPESMPEQALANVLAWLEKKMQPEPEKPKANDVTSFFYYMWNAWCKEECQKAFSSRDNDWQHFWEKWCGICKTHGVYGAAERFYAELSLKHRNMLVKRALEVYEGDCEKQ